MPNAYSKATLRRRAASRVTLTLPSPEDKRLLLSLAAEHPGGAAGLVAALVQQRAHLRAANGKQRRGG